jgi:tetraacyldisaccharide 4'-kinase
MHDPLLPTGDLRESLDNIRRAEVIIITKSPNNISPIERRLIVKDIEKAP